MVAGVARNLQTAARAPAGARAVCVSGNYPYGLAVWPPSTIRTWPVI